MNLIRRIQARMTGYVGKDFMGRPLKVGDMVEPAPATKVSGENVSCRLEVVGVARHPRNGKHGIALVDTFDNHLCFATSTKALLKVDGDEKASWSEIEKTVGWKPEKQKEVSDSEVSA